MVDFWRASFRYSFPIDVSAPLLAEGGLFTCHSTHFALYSRLKVAVDCRRMGVLHDSSSINWQCADANGRQKSPSGVACPKQWNRASYSRCGGRLARLVQQKGTPPPTTSAPPFKTTTHRKSTRPSTTVTTTGSTYIMTLAPSPLSRLAPKPCIANSWLVEAKDCRGRRPMTVPSGGVRRWTEA